MLSTLIENALVVRPGVGSSLSSVLIADGRIAALAPAEADLPVDLDRVDAEGGLLTPGLIDLHTHGVREFLYERSPEDLLRGVGQLAQYGVTCVLPTIYRFLDRTSLTHIERLAAALDQATNVSAPGFHFEGPFLALPGAGAISTPGDLVLLDELLSAARGRVRAMSVSPDADNILPVIERLRDSGIAVFLTHTRANAKQTQAAIDAGARHGTHFYNVFPAPPEIEPGVRPAGAVEVLLTDRRCSVDFICDGVHVDPLAIKLAIQAKGWERVVAITDSNLGAGSEDGVYATPWGYSVRVQRKDAARVHDSTHALHGQLAGSSLTMPQAIWNLLQWIDLPGHCLWAMGTSNPAHAVGLAGKGDLRVGADADVVLWSQDSTQLRALRTWVAGRTVHSCPAECSTRA